MALGVTAPAERSDRGGRAVLLLLGIIVLAAILRFWRLGDWGFESTELFTLRDSNNPRLNNPRPIIYFLNYFLIRPLGPLNELGLRILPALFGVLAVPAMYFLGRRVVGSRAALFSGLLLAVSGSHIYYSQFARYWSLVFLLSAIYPIAIYIGVRERSRPALVLGLVTAILAVLSHPVSILLFGSLGIWVLGMYFRRGQLRQLWSQKGARWGMLVGLAMVAAIATRYVPMLRSWVSMHDKGPAGEFLLLLPTGMGLKQMSYLLAYAESLTLPVVLAGLVGIYHLWRRDRSLGLLMACLALFPVAFLLLVSLRTSISLPYLLMPSAPAFFYGAGVFLDSLTQVEWGVRPRWLIPATMVIIVLTAGAPTVMSQYRDGRRYDFRRVAEWLNGEMRPGDRIFSDQPRVLMHYLPGSEIPRLTRDTVALARSKESVEAAGKEGALWIVAPAPSHAFRSAPGLGRLNNWMYHNCQIRNTVGVGRLDFRQHYLQIYRCPPFPVSQPES